MAGATSGPLRPDRAPRFGERPTFMTSDRYHPLAGAQRDVCAGRGRQSVRRETKDRNVGGRIATDERGLDVAPSG